MQSIKQAILLLAGRGNRIKELTEFRPKCLLEIGGRSFLERALDTLSKCGISKVMLVVGYRAEQIRQVVGGQYQGMEVEYITNHRYAETNTAYSLWLAREKLSSHTLLLEGDIVFEEEVLACLLKRFNGQSAWAAVPVTPQRSEGILLSCNSAGYVSGLKLVRDSQERNAELNFKCAGIQLLTDEVAQAFALRLNETITNGEVQKYADLVLGEILPDISMFLYSLDGMRWAEVDDQDDYQYAQKLFGSLR